MNKIYRLLKEYDNGTCYDLYTIPYVESCTDNLTKRKYQYDEEKAWIVYGAGSLTTMYDVSSLIFGIRPVVSVLKDVLK